MNGLIFGLGAASAVVIVLIIALVIVAFRLQKGLKQLKGDTESTSQYSSELERRINESADQLSREVENLMREIQDYSKNSLEEARSYTDSRIDKTLGEKSK